MPRVFRGFWGRLTPAFSLLVLAAWSAVLGAQTEPAILHDGLECIPANQYPVVIAGIDSFETVRSAKVYFRSDLFLDFYYVEMEPTEAGFQAILPMPSPETNRVIYYVEAVDVAFNGGRSEEHDPEVTDRCKRDPAGALVPGSEPSIVIGALAAGASAIPPGFQAAGIAGFITSAGVASGMGGGIGATTVVAAAAGAAGITGAVVATGGSEETTTTVPSGGVTTTIAGATTSVPGATTTIPGATTTVPGVTTTSIPDGSTTTTTTPGSSTTTTSISSSLEACFTTTFLNSCMLKFDARCSTGDIVETLWEIDTTGVVGGPFIRETPADVYNHDFGTCSGQTITVKLTVTDSSDQTDSTTGTVILPNSLRIFQPESTSELRTFFTSKLSSAHRAEALQGLVVINDRRQDVTDSLGDFRHQFVGIRGKNTIEAQTSSAILGLGLWRFDFSGAEHFVQGSLHIEQGQVASISGSSIVFQVKRRAGRIRFSFRLE